MGIDFRRPRRIRGFGLGEVLIFGPGVGRVLVEKTASGAIASFADGADGVPVKSCTVSFLPSGGGGTPQNPISVQGMSGLSVTRTGKNLVPPTNYMTSYFSVANNGTVSQITTGAPYAWGYENSIFKVTLPAGTYTAVEELITDVTNASHGVQVFNSSNTRITAVSGGTKTAGTYSSTFTLTERTEIGIVCKLYDGTAKLYIVCGSSASSYSAYTSSVVTDTFGQTIYGGTRDLTTDKASVTIAKYQITSFSGTWGAVTNGYGYYVSVADTTHNTAVVISSGMLANHSFTYGSLGRSQAPTWQYGGNDGGVSVQTFILPSEYDTLTKANQWLTNNPLEVTLTLATPTEITGLTPHEIDTLYGDNNIYSNAPKSTTSVTYYADQSLIPDTSTRSLQLSPLPEVDEEVVDEEVEEGVDDMR